MNKFTLLASVATAFANEKCATADELNQANFERYKLKYYNDKTNKWIPIGFDVNNKTGTCGKNSWCLQSNHDTTFKIKGASNSAFRIYSEDKEQVLSFNRSTFGYGFYMYDKEAGYSDTLMNYNANNRLSQGQKLLGVNNDGNETHIFQSGKYPFGSDVEETKFCFVKKASLATLFGFATETAGKNLKEAFEEAFPGVHKFFNDSEANWSEELKNMALESAQKEIQSQIENAVKTKSTEVVKQLTLQLAAFKDPEKQQEIFEMLKKVHRGGEGKEDKKDGNANETDSRTDSKTDSGTASGTPTGTPTRTASGTDFETASGTPTGTVTGATTSKKEQNELLPEQKDTIPPKKKDDDSSVQTPFALCSLALLLFVTY